MNLELRPLLKNIRVIPKTCPQCHSFFIEDQKCESCGHDQAIKVMFGPDDDKSFYNLLDDFYHEKRRITVLGIPLIPNRFFKPYKKLHKKWDWRLEDLFKFLNTSFRLTKTQRFLLIKEAQDIINERSKDLNFAPKLRNLKAKYHSPKMLEIYQDLEFTPQVDRLYWIKWVLSFSFGLWGLWQLYKIIF